MKAISEKKGKDFRSSAQIGKIFHLSAKRIQQLTGDGILETVETPRGRRYDFEKTVETYVQYLSEKANGREKKQADAELETQKLEADVRQKLAKAEIAEMQLAEMKGTMHRAEDVEAITVDHVLFLRSLLMALPGRLAVDLSNIDKAPEAAERIRKEVYDVLKNLENYRYNPDEYKKRIRERQGWENREEEDE